MIHRRALLASIPLAAGLSPGLAAAAGGPFEGFLEGVRAEARRAGVSGTTLSGALAGVRPNARVLELDRHQAEFTMSWDTYRERIVSPARIETGRRAYAANGALLNAIAARFRVDPSAVVAIWGMETNYGGNTGGYGVVEATATLAWEGRRAEYFRRELMAALRILDAGNVAPERMRGSWSGAMGQPQFMPTSFERLAVDFDGDGRRDIWDSRADALGSIANYLARSGWREGEGWGGEVVLPAGFYGGGDSRTMRSLGEWAGMGVRQAGGAPLPAGGEGYLVQPDGPGGPAFLAFPNFNAIRRYNPSNFYALAVGMLSDRVG